MDKAEAVSEKDFDVSFSEIARENREDLTAWLLQSSQAAGKNGAKTIISFIAEEEEDGTRSLAELIMTLSEQEIWKKLYSRWIHSLLVYARSEITGEPAASATAEKDGTAD